MSSTLGSDDEQWQSEREDVDNIEARLLAGNVQIHSNRERVVGNETDVLISERSSNREPCNITAIGRGSRSEERSGASATVARSNREGDESSLSAIELERNTEVGQHSESIADIDDLSVLDFDIEEIFRSIVESDTHSLTENAELSVNAELNADDEPFQSQTLPSLLTLQGLINILRNTLSIFSNSRSSPEGHTEREEYLQRHLEPLARTIFTTLPPLEPLDTKERISILFTTLYQSLEKLHKGLYPDWMRPLVECLAARYGQQVPIGTGRSSEIAADDKPSQKRGPYKCKFCGKPKVTIIRGIKVPHGQCPRDQKSGFGADGNDIDRTLQYPPKELTVKYARISLASSQELGYCVPVSTPRKRKRVHT